MNLLVIGSGGREHSICYKLRQSKRINELFCIPGNAGTKKIAKNISLNISDFGKIYQTIKENKIDIVIVGPEEPLVHGITDFLEKKSIKVLGPSKFASQLEGSKAFMKNLCKKNNIPTANFGIFEEFDKAADFIERSKIPIVVKADGLAAGKGVLICNSKEDARIETKKILNGKFKTSKKVVLEEFLEGEELSYFVLVDKNSYSFFGSAQDHKKVGEGDTGLNTGGMGAYSPAKNLTRELETKIKKKIIEPTLKAMKALKNPYTGFLYAGLMIKNDEPYLIEYNIRMGDPECQVLMTRMMSDPLPALIASADGVLDTFDLRWYDEVALTVVMASQGYPGDYGKGSQIKGIDAAMASDETVMVFHAGTSLDPTGTLLATGGRVLNVTARGATVKEAQARAYAAVAHIDWPEGFCRRDIGWRAVAREES